MKNEADFIWEQLTESQREIADIIGRDNYIKLIKFVDGDSIYIPQYSKLVLGEKIRNDFDGYNIRELAKQYKVTPRTIYNKVPKELREIQRERQLDGQLEF